ADAVLIVGLYREIHSQVVLVGGAVAGDLVVVIHRRTGFERIENTVFAATPAQQDNNSQQCDVYTSHCFLLVLSLLLHAIPVPRPPCKVDLIIPGPVPRGRAPY